MKTDYVQSVMRTFDIIETLKNGAMGLNELSKSVGLSKSTVHRLLSTLMHRGYVIQEVPSSKYRLTLQFLEIGNSTLKDMDIVELSKPYIEELAKQTGEVVHLVLVEDTEIVYIDKIETTSAIRMHSYIGKRIPLYSSAVGKTYLSNMDSVDFDQLWEKLEPSLVQFTPHTIMTKKAMLAELSQVSSDGYAIDNEENEEGVLCVAAPILDRNNVVRYAISVSTPKIRCSEDRIETFGKLVRETAQAISKNLGHLI